MSFDWDKVLDFEVARRNLEGDFYGDWYRDPWGWPELRWLFTAGRLDLVFDRANSKRTGTLSPIDVPKPGFGMRPATVMHPLDRLLYQAAVDRMSVPLIGDLPRWIYGWRLPPDNPRSGLYSRGNVQWAGYTGARAAAALNHPLLLETDIVSCFSTIPPQRVVERARRTCSGAPLDLVEQMLTAWSATPARPGLPQRSRASSVLANFYLRTVDDVLAAAIRPSAPLTPIRWMDDISIFGNHEPQLLQLQLNIISQLRDLGLEMNSGKTSLHEGDAMRNHVADFQLNAIDYELQVGRGPIALDPLINEVIESTEHTARNRIRFLCTRLRSQKVYHRLYDLASVAYRLPHAADDLGRLFRDAGYWRQMSRWYTDFVRSDWALFEWATVGFGTMFPSDERPPSGIVDVVVELLQRGGRRLLLSAFVAQRLPAWNPEAARYHLVQAAANSPHILERRALCYGALAAGADPSSIERLLDDGYDGTLFVEYLRANDWRAPRPVADYAGDAHDDEP